MAVPSGSEQASGGRYSNSRIKSSIKAFALGKAVSAPLTFLLILVLAAVMPRAEYASYVAATAALEIGIIAGMLGMDWFIQTALTRINVGGSRPQLRRAILLMIGISTLPYLLLGAAGWLLADALSSALSGVVSPQVLRIYAVVLMVEGPTRMMRDQMLSALLKQRAVQVSQILRTAVLLGGVSIMLFFDHPITAVQAATFELVAAIVAATVAICALAEVLLALPSRPGVREDLGAWFNPASYRLAASAYGSFMLMLMTGTEVTTALIARYLGVDATAAFGFVARLMETSKKYLPMDMFYGVVRPATIGRYESAGRDFKLLMADVNRMLDANLVVLGLGLAVAIGAGDSLVSVMSNHNVDPPRWLFAVLLLLLIGHSVRRGIELLCYTVGSSTIYLRGAFSCLLIPPLLVVLLPSVGVPHVAALAVCVVDVIFVGIVVAGLRKAGMPVRFGLGRWLRLLLCTALAGGLGWSIGTHWPGMLGMVASILATVLAYPLLVFATRTYRGEDLEWTRSLIRRPPRPETA